MNENEFEIDGVKYVDVEGIGNKSDCDQCVFEPTDNNCKQVNCSLDRADGQDVYFVKAES